MTLWLTGVCWSPLLPRYSGSHLTCSLQSPFLMSVISHFQVLTSLLPSTRLPFPPSPSAGSLPLAPPEGIPPASSYCSFLWLDFNLKIYLFIHPVLMEYLFYASPLLDAEMWREIKMHGPLAIKVIIIIFFYFIGFYLFI